MTSRYTIETTTDGSVKIGGNGLLVQQDDLKISKITFDKHRDAFYIETDQMRVTFQNGIMTDVHLHKQT